MAMRLFGKWGALPSALGLVLSGGGVAFAQMEARVPTGGSNIALSRCVGGPTPDRPCKADAECNGGACSQRSRVDLVVNLARLQPDGTVISGWTPTAAQRTTLANRFSDVNVTLAGATDGQIVLGTVTFIENNGAPNAIVQLSPGTCAIGPSAGQLCVDNGDCGNNPCLAPGTIVNGGEWGNNGKIQADIACLQDSRCFAKQIFRLLGNVRDESEGKLDGDGNTVPDGCEDDLSSNRCFGGPNDGASCDGAPATCTAPGACGPIRCIESGPGCLMEWRPGSAPTNGQELCFAGNHDPDRDTEQSQCRQNHSCWEQLGLEWPSVIRVPQAAGDIQPEPPADLTDITTRFEAPDFDRFVAVVDRSGSMAIVEGGQSRLQRAVDAVKNFVDMLSVNSQLGLASFSSSVGGVPPGVDATKDFPGTLGLQTIADDAVRNEAKSQADALLARGSGGTRIGAGLRMARDMLLEGGGSISINSSVLLLTDGLNNQPAADPQGDLDAALGELSSARLPVFVTCIGEARDSVQCSNIADRTAGRFVDSATTASLYDAFVDFVAQAERNGIAQAQIDVPISPGEEAAPIPVLIEPGAREARFVISWAQQTSDLDLELTRPDGTLVPTSERVSGAQTEFYRLDNPPPGTWLMRVRDVTAPARDGSPGALAAPNHFSARALVDHDLIHLDAGLARSTLTWPAAFLINAAPLFGRSLEGCQAEAAVQKPDGTSEVVPLLDGGQDGDNDARDGLYGAHYRNFTAGDGIYTFLVRVRCEQGVARVVNRGEPGSGGFAFDPTVPTFERTLRFSGIVTAVPDNLPPVAKICSNVQVECQGATTPVPLDGTCSVDPEGSPLGYSWSSPTGSFSVGTGAQPTGHFSVGHHTVQLEVADAEGSVSSPDLALVSVGDTTAPAIQSLEADPSSLWPPLGGMEPVALTVQAADACDAGHTCQITSVTSNYPPTPGGDWEVTGPLSLKLRKKLGLLSPVVYKVSVTCSDASGNQSTSSVVIPVKLLPLLAEPPAPEAQ
ncbi:MAG TPA: VWA domain-containing protein [Polyangiaceae bacterium]|nr:VWA domain-containing protein [Polyangiaceae bacterium]